MKTLDRHPSFRYERSITTDGRIILLDEPITKEARLQMEGLKAVDASELLFLEDKDLATDLERILEGILSRESDILLVFPGNGSNYPRKLSNICRTSQGAAVHAERFWEPGIDPIVTAGDILPSMFMVMGVETVVVVDDVISSGMTLRKIHDRNSWKFPRAKWIGTSWVSQVPQTKGRSGVPGYESIETACVVGKINGNRVPVNSISTLRQNQKIAKNYAERHFKDPALFLSLLKE